ncbi:methyltransferase [Sulfurimonas sp.]|uniref:methyltransferase n=1 Tax=Sulfurimonas sp. TaxID=2022749 RepID=UPI0035687D55
MLNISFNETHHIENGQPLYETRYKRVMSFHDNIAPVETENESFFINRDNQKLFNRTFKKAYGFYEGVSAVYDAQGWFHIDSNGMDIYAQRYQWVGNFQEALCVVRDSENNYFHINKNGSRLYNDNYSYTGDFKYGIAVVINEEGKATHIGNNGSLLHLKYFDELDLFHKGYAVAKDAKGYFHINKNGDELYKDRYQKLEPFYNGVALATNFSGQKVIIEETEVNPLAITQERVDKEKILNESFGYFKYQILFSILKLDVLKCIQDDKSIDLPEISVKLIIRWLKVEGIIDIESCLTKKGKLIESELKPLILYWQDLPFKVSSRLVESLHKGDEVFSDMYGKPFFEYLQDNTFIQNITSAVHEYYTTDYKELVNLLEFGEDTICDIGGGNGALLTAIKKYNKNTTTILLDKFNQNTEHKFYKIDFFKPFSVHSDIFLLSRILHDWNDENAIIILKNVANNMSNDSILYIFDTIIPEQILNDKGHTLSFHLLSFLGGYERTFADFERILEKSNLKIINVYAEDNLISILKVKK